MVFRSGFFLLRLTFYKANEVVVMHGFDKLWGLAEAKLRDDELTN